MQPRIHIKHNSWEPQPVASSQLPVSQEMEQANKLCVYIVLMCIFGSFSVCVCVRVCFHDAGQCSFVRG